MKNQFNPSRPFFAKWRTAYAATSGLLCFPIMAGLSGVRKNCDQESSMKRATVIRILSLGLLCLLCTAALAQEFSADVVTTDKSEAGQSTKIYVSKNKIRF